MLRVAPIAFALFVFGCGRKTDPPAPLQAIVAPREASTPEPVAPKAPEGMRALVIPPGVTEMTYGGLQTASVEVKMTTTASNEWPPSGRIEVPEQARMRAGVKVPTPELVRWANANEVILAISCSAPVPADLRRVSCNDLPSAGALGAKLEVLELAVQSDFTDEELAKLPPLPVLEELGLGFDRVTNAGLAQLDRFPMLRRLGLQANRLDGGTGLEHVAKLGELTTLDISATMLADADIARITNPKLLVLSIANTNATDRALEAAAKLVHLESLDLAGTKVTDEGLRKLGPLTALALLDVEDTAVTEAGCAAFTKIHVGARCLRKAARAPDTGPAQTRTVLGSLTVVDLSPADGPLREQLRKEHAAHPKNLMVETTASWCKPCIAIQQYLSDPAMVAALAGVTLVHVDFDRFEHEELEACGIPAESLPWFVILDENIRVKDALSSSEWDDDVPANMAPVLASFARGTLRARRHPWK